MSFLLSYYDSEVSRPSFFELLAQDRMMPSLRLALKYACTVFASRHSGLEWTVKHNLELFALLQLIIERHFLKHYDASFSEHFYGLKRTKLVPNENYVPTHVATAAAAATTTTQSTTSTPSTTSGSGAAAATTTTSATMRHHRQSPYIRKRPTDLDKFISLLFIVGIPYVKAKIDRLYSHQFGRNGTQLSDHTVSQFSNLKKLFYKLWPYFNAAYEGTFFMYILFYLFGYTQYYTPFLHLQKMQLRRLSTEDMIAQKRDKIARRQQTIAHIESKPGAMARLYSYVMRLGYNVSDYSRYALLGAVFLLKFLEWWYSSESKFATPSTQQPIPPPPEAPQRAAGGIELPRSNALCPLCKKPRQNPTLVPVSGFTFCYSCIHTYVDTHQRCPVTLLPTNLDQLRRIYETTADH